jgi:hypothetical protein
LQGFVIEADVIFHKIMCKQGHQSAWLAISFTSACTWHHMA